MSRLFYVKKLEETKNRVKQRKYRKNDWVVDFIDFAYLSRDTVYTGLATSNRMVTAVINKASDQIDRIAERRARQVV